MFSSKVISRGIGGVVPLCLSWQMTSASSDCDSKEMPSTGRLPFTAHTDRQQPLNVAAVQPTNSLAGYKRFVSHMDNTSSTANLKNNSPFTESLENINDIAILPGTTSTELTNEICALLNKTPTPMGITRFSDGEISVEIRESIRGKDCFVIQTCRPPVNDNLVELFLMITAAKRSGASSVTVIVPYLAYKHHRRGLPMSSTYHSRFLWSASADMAKMLQALGADKIVSVDLQRPGQGHEASFLNAGPVETISSTDSYVQYAKTSMDLQSPLVLVAPNTEYVKKVSKYRQKLKKELKLETVETAVFLSDGDESSKTSEELLLGYSVKDADVIIVDDIVDTAGQLSQLCRRLKKEGARRVFVFASHGIFAANSIQLIDLSPVEKVIVTNSIPLPRNKSSPKIEQISIAPLLAKIIYSESVTKDEIIPIVDEKPEIEIAEDNEVFEIE